MTEIYSWMYKVNRVNRLLPYLFFALNFGAVLCSFEAVLGENSFSFEVIRLVYLGA
jgi:hypothetical protein